jgi:hypothetical protein
MLKNDGIMRMNLLKTNKNNVWYVNKIKQGNLQK